MSGSVRCVLDSITCANVRNVRFCVRLCPVMSSHVQSCPVVSGNVCYPSIGAPFSRIPSPSPISSLNIASDLPELLTPNASPSWEDRHLPVRWWTLASTKCRTLGRKNGILKSRTDMFSNPMRRGWGSAGGPTGQGQVPGALNGTGAGPRCLER